MSLIEDELLRRRFTESGGGDSTTTLTAAVQPPTAPSAPSLLNAAQRLNRNPQLPQHPLGAYTDAQYEANVAQLRAATSRKYQQVLQQLGFMDPESGQFVKGDVEVQADLQRQNLAYQMGEARRQAEEEAQRNSTVFSGKRAEAIARAEHPFVQSLADLDVMLPRQLGSLYDEAMGVLSEFNTGQNLELANAAARRAEQIRQQQAADAEAQRQKDLLDAINSRKTEGSGVAPPPAGPSTYDRSGDVIPTPRPMYIPTGGGGGNISPIQQQIRQRSGRGPMDMT